jgi:hypothetical protein
MTSGCKLTVDVGTDSTGVHAFLLLSLERLGSNADIGLREGTWTGEQESMPKCRLIGSEGNLCQPH